MKTLLSFSLIVLACYGGYTVYQNNHRSIDRAVRTASRETVKVTKKTFDVISSAVHAGYNETRD